MNLTEKQLAILQVIVNKNEDGSDTDLDQLIERLDYKPSKASIHFSLRALILHGLIAKEPEWEKRRGRKRVIIRATGMAKAYVTPRAVETIPLNDSSSVTDDLLIDSGELEELIE